MLRTRLLAAALACTTGGAFAFQRVPVQAPQQSVSPQEPGIWVRGPREVAVGPQFTFCGMERPGAALADYPSIRRRAVLQARGIELHLSEYLLDPPNHSLRIEIARLQAHVIRGFEDEGMPKPDIYSSTHLLRARHTPTAIASQGSHEWYVAGTRRVGKRLLAPREAILERWTLTPARGEPVVVAPRPRPGQREQPKPYLRLASQRYIPANLREAPTHQAVELYSGDLTGPIDQILVHPQAPFLLTFSKRLRRLCQVPLDGSGAVRVLLSPASHPFLEQATRLRVHEHPAHGWVYLLDSPGSAFTEEYLVILDPGGNGLHDDEGQFLNKQAWRESSFGDRRVAAQRPGVSRLKDLLWNEPR